MKVCLLYDQFGRSSGGVEAWLYHAALALKFSGADVCAIATSDGDVPSDAMPEGVDAHYVGLPNAGKIPGLRAVLGLNSFSKTVSEIAKDADVFWARSFRTALAACTIKQSKPVVFIQATPNPFYSRTITDTSSLNLARRIRYELKLLLTKYLEVKAMSRSSFLVYLSKSRCEETLAFYGERFRRKAHVVPPGVDINRFKPNEKVWNGNGTLHLITVCRLSKEKNIASVIKALDILVKHGIPIDLKVVGDGPERLKLEKLTDELKLRKYIYFEGEQRYVENFYADAHIFILPSVYEGFGAVYLEALASGLPCIALKNIPGKYLVASDEIIEHEKLGILIDHNSPAAISDAIYSAYKRPEDVMAWSKYARVVCEKKYQWNTCIQKLLALTGTVNDNRKTFHW